MSRPVKFNWTTMDVSAVCVSQATAGAGALIINGTLATKNDAENRTAIFEGLERTVSIRSTVDLSAISFTITGTLRGAVVSQTRLGPNATTEYTTQNFTTVTSVTVNGAVANASIGSGNTGSTFWFLSDYHRSHNALNVSVFAVASLTYTFETTLDDISTVVNPVVWFPIDGVTIPVIPAGGDMINATASAMANYTIPTRFSRIKVTASDATGDAEIYFLQQGVL